MITVASSAASMLGRLAVLGGLCLATLRAQESDVRSPDPQMPGVFNTELPNTEARNHLRLIIRPHFGDLHRHDHLRVPVGARYGLGDSLEASAEVETFFAHGLGDAAFGSRLGISGFRLAAKERLPHWERFPELETVLGLSITQPIGSPPPELTDGRRHLAPFITFSEPVRGVRGLSAFTSFGADFASETRYTGVRNKNAFLDDAAIFTTGAVWRGERITSTLELSYATSAFGSREDRKVFSIRPGIAWRLPNTRWFQPDGKWIVGVGTHVGFGPEGTDVGLNVKVRGEFDFRRWVRSWRQ